MDYFNVSREQLVNRLATAKLSLGRHPYPLPSSALAIEEKMGRLAANLVLPPAAIRPAEAAIASQIRPVYHGSPHQFEKFQSSAIGSGEGAQAFGWGHYFTESPAIARFYSGVGVQNKIDMWKAFRKEQPDLAQEVQNLFKNSQGKLYGNTGNFASKLRTLTLRETDIPKEKELAQRIKDTGFKWPSGTLSGIKGSTKHNYVVFDPADITIDVIK